MKKFLVYLPLLFFLAHFTNYAQSPKLSNGDVTFKVYKEYDANGNLIRYDSSRVEKREKFLKNFQFKLNTDSIPFLKFDMDSLQLPNKFFLFKDLNDLDSISINFLEFYPLEMDSILKNIHPRAFHFRRNKNDRDLDSLLERHFEKMEKLFEDLMETHSAPKARKKIY